MDPCTAAIAHGFAATLTAKLPAEQHKERGAIEPWQVCPSADTPACRSARDRLREMGRKIGKKIRIKL